MIRRLGAGLATTAVIFGLILALAASAAAEGSGTCDPTHETCTVGTGGGGRHGTGGRSGPRSTQDPCADFPDAAYGDKPPKVSQACADRLQGNYCSAIQADALGGLEVGGFNDLPPEEIAALNKQFISEGCPAIVTPATLAEQAFKTITFPYPSGHRSPSELLKYNGAPFTYVGLWTYYWTAPATWKPLTATAAADGFTATVTAVPVSLSFDPGDGSDRQSCPGPGRPWTESDGNSAPSGGACGYQYSRVSGPGYDHPITSTQTISWKITWTGTGNSAGEIPGLSTSTSGQLNVLQIKTVNR